MTITDYYMTGGGAADGIGPKRMKVVTRQPTPLPTSPLPSFPPSSPVGKESGSTNSRSGHSLLLYSLLLSDIEKDGRRMFIPFLTTTDLLRLSECSSGLVKYRNFLSRVKIVSHPHPTPISQRGLLCLLEQQVKVTCLRLADRMAVAVLSMSSWGWFEGLKTLDLSDIGLTDSDANGIGRALSTGGLSSLEELNISGVWSKLTANGLAYIIQGLIRGGCSGLRRLDLVGCALGRGGGQVIGDVLETGHCRALRDLHLSGSKLGMGGFMTIARGLQRGGSPDLRRLELSGCLLSAQDGHALGAALMSPQACPRLEFLSLSGSPNMGDEGLVPVMNALARGGCPMLKRLDLEGANMTEVGGAAFARALLSSGCPDLQYLLLYRAFKHPDGTMHVLKAIKKGTCPNLRHLDLVWNEMDPMHCRVLGEAFESNACPQLELLRLSGNPYIGSEGMEHIVRALDKCPNLRHLRLKGVGMGRRGAQALASAAASGSLRSLCDISVSNNEDIGDEAMTVVLRALADGCPRLEVLSISKTGVGEGSGEVLLHALQEGAWPHLQDLFVMNKNVGVKWVCELAEAIERGAGGGLRNLGLHCSCGPVGVYHLSRAFIRGACPSLACLYMEISLSQDRDMMCLDILRASLECRATVGIELAEEHVEGSIDSIVRLGVSRC